MAMYFQSFINNKVTDQLVNCWGGTLINKVEIERRKKTWKLYLLLPEPVSRAILKDTEDQLMKHHEFLEDIQLIPSLKDCCDGLRQIIANRRDDLLSHLSAGQKLFDAPGISWKVSGRRVDILSRQMDIYEYIVNKEICPRLANWFWQEYSLQVLVRVVFAGQAGMVGSGDNYLTDRQLEVIAPPRETAGTGKRETFRRERKRLVETIRDQSLAIADLEEGMNTAVTEGEIWDKKAFSFNDGRLASYLYLTDFEDSIVVKVYWTQEDDAKVNRGDRIKVKGGIRFDNRIKEPILFLEQYAFLEKIIRSDNSDEKRIELHAHTKMSSMDGLTEVKELINRAAQWQHTAIAITDHASIQAFPVAYDALQELRKKGDCNLKIIYGVEGYLVEEDKKERPYHIVLLVRNRAGLKNLYKLISLGYLHHFYRQPRLPRQEIQKYRQGLLLGTACEAGELFQAILAGASEDEIETIVAFYDYLEIQPLANNAFMLRKGLVASKDDLININRRIISLGEKYNKPVIASGDVHFLDPQHEKFRTIIKAGQDYEDAEEHLPLYFRTTDEMLQEFSYLGAEEAQQVVIEAPARVASLIEDIKPVPDGFYPPKIEGAAEEIAQLTWDNAHAKYGPQLPAIVEQRIKRELDSIIGNGFAVLYLIAHQLVKKSNEDGYLVGSRGSVGSSLVAYLTGITEVNALPPHYICRKCYGSEFILDNSVGCGADLEDKQCLECGGDLDKDGFDIPFETFMGFEGDKVPDIDLNFSGDYQSRAHQYVEELFGSQNVFRAGTISTIAEKTAFGFVKKYAEKHQKDIKGSEMARLAAGMTGVRRTTGQHPGGLIVVPKDKDILDFTPLQHPADNKDSGIITTHFEYHAIGDQLVKLDILGHDDPTVIKELEDLTGIKAAGISLSDSETMKLFSGVEPLGIRPEDIDSTVGTYGIPEFGTPFVRQMLEATRPTAFAELVRISGLSHGTDVWLNNAQTLIAEKVAGLNEVICTRDDIMTYLIHKGMDKIKAFEIMEKVRKGKGLKDQDIEIMENCDVPAWYVTACQKIKYMFPKAHAVAYVTMAFRIAWYKINCPLAFYSSFFGIRAEDFDAETILGGYDMIRERVRDIIKQGYNASPKEKKLLIILELAMEMCARGYHFLPVDIYKSDAHKFIVENGGLRLPFAALPNVGAAAAQSIISSRQGGGYVSIEDFQVRTRLNKSAMDLLRKEDCFAGWPEKTQISLFA